MNFILNMMVMKIRTMISMRVNQFVIMFSAIFLLTSNLYAKKSYPMEDGQTWGSFQIKKVVLKNLDVELSQELRYSDYSTKLNQSLTDIGLSYKLSNFFKVGLFYRYRNLILDEEIRDEVYANASFKYAWNDFTFTDRARLHIKFRDDDETINNFRNKLKIDYNTSTFVSPFIESEIFYRFIYENGDRVTQARYALGLAFEITDYLEIDTYFMREQEYNTKKAIHSNIIGIDFSVNLK